MLQGNEAHSLRLKITEATIQDIPRPPTLQADSLLSEPQGKPNRDPMQLKINNISKGKF